MIGSAMGQFSSRVKRLLSELRASRDADPIGSVDVERLTPRITDLLLSALDDPGHPLAEDLTSLRELIDRYRAKPEPKVEGCARTKLCPR